MGERTLFGVDVVNNHGYALGFRRNARPGELRRQIVSLARKVLQKVASMFDGRAGHLNGQGELLLELVYNLQEFGLRLALSDL